MQYKDELSFSKQLLEGSFFAFLNLSRRALYAAWRVGSPQYTKDNPLKGLMGLNREQRRNQPGWPKKVIWLDFMQVN